MIKAEGLFFSYTGAAPYVLNGIDLEIKDGEYVSLVGDNGSGKSTLVRLMLRFLKPTAGTISCSAKRIGYVPQKNDFANSDFPITVFESLNSYRHILRVADKSAVNRSLERVGMTEYANARMGALSGGQGQRCDDCARADRPAGTVDSGRTVLRRRHGQSKGDIRLFKADQPAGRHYHRLR